jgi:hypothetical protein
MPAQLDIYGTLIPSLAGLMVIAYLIVSVIRVVLTRIGGYRLVWHRSLFNVALYVLILGALVAITQKLPT